MLRTLSLPSPKGRGMRGGTDRIIFHISFDISHLSFELDAIRATIIISKMQHSLIVKRLFFTGG